MANEIKLVLKLDDREVEATLKDLPADFKKSGDKSGKGFSKGFEDSFSRSLSVLRNRVLGIGTALVAAFGAKRAIEAAARQQDAIQRLNNSLAQIGEFSQATSKDLQDYASSIEQTTRFADEAILEQLTFAQALGATAEQSKQVVSAAADLATATGVDLNSAVRNVAKTLGGYAGELGEVIPELKNLTQEQLRAGAGVDLLAKKFSGLAAKDVATFSGATEQLSNSFGTLLENIGKTITNSPAVIKVINILSGAFDDLAKAVSSIDTKELLLDLVQFAIDVTSFVVTPLKAVFNIFATIFNGIKVVVQAFPAAIGTVLGSLSRLAESLGVSNPVTKALKQFQESSNEVFAEFLEDTKNSFLSIADTETADKLKERLEIIRNQILKAGDVTPLVENLDKNVSKALTGLDALSAGFKKVGESATRGLVNGVAQGFAAVGAALVKGENALDAFLKSFLSALGQIAIQQGTLFILQGLGFSVIPGLQASGGALIAAGTALTVLGGALTAFAGGLGSAPSTGVSTTATEDVAVAGAGTVGDIAATEREEVQPTTTIIVNGDLFESEDGDIRLVERINRAADRNGATINRSALA